MDRNNSSVVEKLTKIKPLSSLLFLFARPFWHMWLAKKADRKCRRILKKRLKITVQLCEFVSPLTSSWINGHACRCANHRLLSSIPQPLMSPWSENRRGWFTCACGTQSKRPGPLFTAPPMQKKRKTSLCGDLCESYLSVPETEPETLISPLSSKRSGPRRHLAGAALCVYKQTQTYKKIYLQAPCESVHCAHWMHSASKCFKSPAELSGRKAAA